MDQDFAAVRRMGEQGKKLMQMIGACVEGLDALDQLVPTVKDLGRRHAGYGVTDAHYQTVGGALLWTLERARLRLHARREGAWTTVYTVLATTMKAGAQEQV